MLVCCMYKQAMLRDRPQVCHWHSVLYRNIAVNVQPVQDPDKGGAQAHQPHPFVIARAGYMLS